MNEKRFTPPAPGPALDFVAFDCAVRRPDNKPVTYVRGADAHGRRGVQAYLSTDGRWIVLVDVAGEQPSRHVHIGRAADIVFAAEVEAVKERAVAAARARAEAAQADADARAATTTAAPSQMTI